jgi:phytoene desaturase
VIIGAGLGGLSAALHLAAAGREVTVLERAAFPGGRVGVISEAGYRFDTGPTVLTMPELIAETLGVVGESLEDWLDLRRLDPAYRARFADGSTIEVHSDADAMELSIRGRCGAREAAGYRRFVDHVSQLYRVEMPHFIARNLDSPTQLISRPMLDLLRLGALRRLGPTVRSFFGDERLQRIFSFQAVYAGLAPAQALGIYAVIGYLDCVRGVYFPAGGMHTIPLALAGVAAKHGVQVRCDTEVTKIEVTGGRARAVITAHGERIAADAVVVNADAPTAYRELLPPRLTPRRGLKHSPSCVVLHTGSRTEYEDSAHHTICFGHAWDATFRQLIQRGETMTDPSFLITHPTVTDPALAPPGRQVYYVLFPAPNLAHREPIEWDRLGPRYREHMLTTVARYGHPGFADAIETTHLVTPADWARLGCAAGTPFAAAHTFGQTGPFRLPTLDRHIENLVFCGASVQPGVGVPMVLISGRLAAQRITGEPVSDD